MSWFMSTNTCQAKAPAPVAWPQMWELGAQTYQFFSGKQLANYAYSVGVSFHDVYVQPCIFRMIVSDGWKPVKFLRGSSQSCPDLAVGTGHSCCKRGGPDIDMSNGCFTILFADLKVVVMLDYMYCILYLMLSQTLIWKRYVILMVHTF